MTRKRILVTPMPVTTSSLEDIDYAEVSEDVSEPRRRRDDIRRWRKLKHQLA